MVASDVVTLRFDGPLARITIHRPPLNVLTVETLDQLRAAFERAVENPGVRLVRLDAEGKLFSAGVDVRDHLGDRVGPMLTALRRLFDLLDGVEPPTVAVVHAAAIGGGSELALATDLCFASERASFSQPEIRLGLFAPLASVLLPRRIGERQALGLLLSGEAIDAREAERMGLVNAVLPHESFAERVAERLDRLLSLSGCALRYAKRAVRQTRGLPAADARRTLESLYEDGLMRSHDANEGLHAFLEKRPPLWKHR